MLFGKTGGNSLLQSHSYRPQSRKRSRVVTAGLLEDLFARLAIDQPAAGRGPVQHQSGQTATRFSPGQAVPGEPVRRGHGNLAQDAARNDLIHEAQAEGLRGTLAPAGENHVQSGARTDEAGEPLAPAGARDEPELHLGEPELGLGMIGGDPVMTGKRQLQASAETSTMDRRDDRLLRRLHSADRLLAFEAEPLRLGLGGESGELLDVGAGNEVVGLPRDQDDTSDCRVLTQLSQQ
jgi:hypothetical protein